MKLCQVIGCGREHYSGGLCSRHYNRIRVAGSLEDGPKAHLPLEDRFWRYVDKRGPNECWNWTGGLSCGYGQIGEGGRAGRKLRAHRVSYELHIGPVPKGKSGRGKVVMHTCDNRKCVNPTHLRLAEWRENIDDMNRKKRGDPWGHKRNPRHGEKHKGAKLTDDLVRRIRQSPLSGAELARQLGMNRSTINRVRRGESWSHIKS